MVVLAELLARYGASLGRAWWVLAVTAVALGLAALLLRGHLPARHNGRALALVLGVAAVGAVAHAWQLRWLSDDAFISFRYAVNWANGNGLVFNPGERVEGYTNFLWTALMAGGITVGLEPAQLSIVLTLASLAGSVVMTGRLVRRLCPPDAILPGTLAAAGLAANYTFASFGTSGLETVPAALLVLVAVERAIAGAPLLAGTLGVLAGLAHPDHLIFYGALGIVTLGGPGARLRTALRYGAPFLALFVPYYVARYAYYGDFFPNTYYAKSGGDAYFSQGSVYLAVSLICAGLIGILPLAAISVIRRRATPFGRFLALSIPLYCVYVAKIGGDFMLGRLVCVMLPLLLVAAELGARDLAATRRPPLEALAFAAFMPLAVPNRVIPPQEDFHRVCDERTWYPLRSFAPIRLDEEFSQRADALLEAFASAPRSPRIGFCCVGIIGYRTGYYVLDQFGLTSRAVAHLPIATRGRTGHEKVAGPGFSFESDLDLSGGALWPEPYEGWAKLGVGPFEYSLARYDRTLLGSLGAGSRVPSLEQRIRDYSPLDRGLDERACDIWFFEQIYFSHGADPAVEDGFVRRLSRDMPDLSGLEALLFERPLKPVPGFDQRVLFDFENLNGWARRGKAFEGPPSRGEALGQSRVFGQRARFLNGFHRKLGDRATGSIRSPSFELEGDALSLRIGGGRMPDRVEVRLRVDGQTVKRVTGCDSELLGRRVIPTGAWRGRTAELEIVDRSEKPWGHVTVDEVVEWIRRD